MPHTVNNLSFQFFAAGTYGFVQIVTNQ